MRLAAMLVALTALFACSAPQEEAAPNLSPAPREAPEEEPEEFGEAPANVGGGAPAPEPGSTARAAARAVCDRLAALDSADDPVAYLDEVAATAGAAGVALRRFVTLLRRALAKGKRSQARDYLDRLGALCEEATGRRSF